eukprot:m.169328 g.169328  ORF g.169328 m.169328 type:complete len:261 (-) comp14492_c2_seq1:1977-2759(-)
MGETGVYVMVVVQTVVACAVIGSMFSLALMDSCTLTPAYIGPGNENQTVNYTFNTISIRPWHCCMTNASAYNGPTWVNSMFSSSRCIPCRNASFLRSYRDEIPPKHELTNLTPNHTTLGLLVLASLIEILIFLPVHLEWFSDGELTLDSSIATLVASNVCVAIPLFGAAIASTIARGNFRNHYDDVVADVPLADFDCTPVTVWPFIMWGLFAWTVLGTFIWPWVLGYEPPVKAQPTVTTQLIPTPQPKQLKLVGFLFAEV